MRRRVLREPKGKAAMRMRGALRASRQLHMGGLRARSLCEPMRHVRISVSHENCPVIAFCQCCALYQACFRGRLQCPGTAFSLVALGREALGGIMVHKSICGAVCTGSALARDHCVTQITSGHAQDAQGICRCTPAAHLGLKLRFASPAGGEHVTWLPRITFWQAKHARGMRVA